MRPGGTMSRPYAGEPRADRRLDVSIDEVSAVQSQDALPDVVHQATGMVAVQLGLHVGPALREMTVYASANGRALQDVASEVVSRKLRFGGPRDDRHAA